MSVNTREVLNLTQDQQVSGLIILLNRVSEDGSLSTESKDKLTNLLTHLQPILNGSSNQKVYESFNETNRFLAEIEKDSNHKTLLKKLKEQGLYTILYHNSPVRGIMDDGCSLVNLGGLTIENATEEFTVKYELYSYFNNKSGYALCRDGIIYFEYNFGKPRVSFTHTQPDDTDSAGSEAWAKLQAIFPTELNKARHLDASEKEQDLIKSITGHSHSDIGMVNLLKIGYVGLGVSALFVVMFAAVTVFGGPLWLFALSAGLFAGAVAYVGALVYGVVNDLFAVKDNLAYFLLGHQPQQHSMLRTNDPIAIGVAWGVSAVSGLGIIAGVAFAVGVGIISAFFPPAAFALPILLLTLPLIAWGADLVAKWKARQYEQNGDHQNTILYGNGYQREGWETMMPTPGDHAAWLATGGPRNGFGFIGMPIVGVVALAVILTLTGVGFALPGLLFAPMVAIAIPILVTTIAILALAGLGVYTYANRNKQTDDRYKLDFDLDSNVTPENRTFYFNDHPDLISAQTTQIHQYSDDDDESEALPLIPQRDRPGINDAVSAGALREIGILSSPRRRVEDSSSSPVEDSDLKKGL